uniref:Uncharacterized protein n=1 Tax=Candidatus Kentrum sp. SD TaxID=2126332 RepID=A0A450YSX8_9GAMM|nr:MAG: hypothetical protein BECKSD772F_GA0070984_104017 [Candidatus Kentron sp. SD]VFK44589.1 MAG: hypothetical protein BECKSD772E_GA0070983_104017 [Candidatus Kentron sp. SD]VFK79021.1 MAG: hypothetical protein BECKSD772D_GA0070982_10333 [Candidatus Kentron sp. SD]
MGSKPGQDAAAFMEKMRADPKIRRVVMICDRIYAEKADGRAGCVGMEARIISAGVYARPSRNS